MKQIIKYLVLFFFAITFEYARDYLFININLQLDFLENSIYKSKAVNYTDSILLKFLKNWSIENLIYLKWIFSILFALLFYILGYIFSIFTFNPIAHNNFKKNFSFFGVLILLLSFLIFSLSKLLSLENQINFYYVSIGLSHFVQSSLYPISFLLIFYANNRKMI